MNESASRTSDSPWHGTWLSPLNLAAYITWLAMLLQSVSWDRLGQGDVLQWSGLSALLAVLVGYLLATAQDGAAPVATPDALNRAALGMTVLVSCWN